MTPPSTLRPGDQLTSSVCTTKVVVVRAPAGGNPVIACGGSPMVPASSGASGSSAPSRPSAAPASGGGGEPATLLGKRYVDGTGEVELLCVTAGTGELTCDGAPMTLKAAKPLPASD